jgi:transposase
VHRDPARVEVLKPPTLGVPVLVEPTLMCRALVGLADVEVVGVIAWTVPIQIHIASTTPRPLCSSCGRSARVKQTLRRRLVDLPSFGRPVATMWRQVRWWCPDEVCAVGSWMQTDRRIVVGNRDYRPGGGLLAAGDPKHEVADAWTAKEAVREIYRIGDPALALDWVSELAATLDDRTYSPEIRRLGRTLKRWGPQIAAWHTSRASNGPVEAINNLAKRIKRVAFGITNWTHWRVRVLLYASKPDWTKLATITPAAP